MDILQEARDINKKSLLSHVFSTTDEGKAEILNIVQYATLGIFPIVLLNKLVHRFIPEADGEKATLELLVEIFLQVIIMFCGIILIHRTISYFPTYSGFKYDNLTLTNVVLAFLVIFLSIQTKLVIKVNVLTERALELWNGPDVKAPVKKRGSLHTVSQSDYFEDLGDSIGMPPPPVVTSRSSQQQQQQPQEEMGSMGGPQAANSVLGGSFGSFF